jgi:sirohydrochlorin ferrochelatase
MPVALMPNVNTPEKEAALMAAVAEQEKAHDAIVRFVNHNERDIEAALRIAMDRGFISSDKDHDLENGEGNILEAFREHMREWRNAIDNTITITITGKI